MFSECNVTSITNGIESGTFQNKSDYFFEIVNYFECFLTRKYKQKYTIDICLKNVEQYINWYSLNNIDAYFILNKENYDKYEFYLKHSKQYKKSTILSKIISLRKLNEFLIGFNQQQNSNENFSDCLKSNKYQYNYLTESYIRLH